jgi:hypothetical protein
MYVSAAWVSPLINAAQTITGVQTFSADPIIPDEVYGAGWNGSLEPPTKNAVYDKIEAVVAAVPTVSDDVYGAGWNGVTTISPSKNAVYDKLELIAADYVPDTGNTTIDGVKTFSSDPLIPDEAYGAGWNGSLEPPTKNAVYDKIETIVSDTGRTIMTGNRTYYVRTDGNDSNTGLTDSAGGAFLTVQKAVDVCATLDIGEYVLTIDVGDGTWTTAIVIDKAPLGTRKSNAGVVNFVLQGDNGSAVNLNTTSASAITIKNIPHIKVSGFHITTTTAGKGLLVDNSHVDMGWMEFGACADEQILVNNHGLVWVTASYSVSGGAPGHLLLDGPGAAFDTDAITVTLTGTPDFSDNTVAVYSTSFCRLRDVTFSGAATGTRYDVQQTSTLYTNGGASYVPGDGAGGVSNGGVYC